MCSILEEIILSEKGMSEYRDWPERSKSEVYFITFITQLPHISLMKSEQNRSSFVGKVSCRETNVTLGYKARKRLV